MSATVDDSADILTRCATTFSTGGLRASTSDLIQGSRRGRGVTLVKLRFDQSSPRMGCRVL